MSGAAVLLVDALDEAEGRLVARRVGELHVPCSIAALRPPPPPPPPPQRLWLQPALQRFVVLVEREQTVVVVVVVVVVRVVRVVLRGEGDAVRVQVEFGPAALLVAMQFARHTVALRDY